MLLNRHAQNLRPTVVSSPGGPLSGTGANLILLFLAYADCIIMPILMLVVIVAAKRFKFSLAFFTRGSIEASSPISALNRPDFRP